MGNLAPLRATIIRTFPSCYGAERNAFDTDGKHHLNIAITLAIQYLPSPLRSVPQSSSSYGAERNAFGWEHHLKIAISLAIQYLPSPLRSVLQSLVQALEHFPVPTEWSGTLLTIMGTPLELCNFSSHSIFPCSAMLRATIIGTSTWTVPSSYGAERNAFGWEHHLNVAISLAIHYFPAPLRSVPQSLVQALEHFPVPTEPSRTLLDGNTTWTLQFL